VELVWAGGITFLTVPLSPPMQDNSEVHFKVRQTTKFQKVRGPLRSLPHPPHLSPQKL